MPPYRSYPRVDVTQPADFAVRLAVQLGHAQNCKVPPSVSSLEKVHRALSRGVGPSSGCYRRSDQIAQIELGSADAVSVVDAPTGSQKAARRRTARLLKTFARRFDDLKEASDRDKLFAVATVWVGLLAEQPFAYFNEEVALVTAERLYAVLDIEVSRPEISDPTVNAALDQALGLSDRRIWAGPFASVLTNHQ